MSIYFCLCFVLFLDKINEYLYFIVRSVLNEDIFVDCERFMEGLLERPEGRNTLKIFFEDNDKFVRLLLLSANQNFSLSFVYRMLKFVSRTLETCEFMLNNNCIVLFIFSSLQSLFFR